MHILWTLSGILTKNAAKEKRQKCFRLLACTLSGLTGLILWGIVQLFALNSLDWLICFVGYPVMFFGVLGSSFYLICKDNDLEE